MTAAPAAVVSKGRLYVFETGTDHVIYENVLNGSLWYGFMLVGGLTYIAPGATTYNNLIYLFDIGTDGRVYFTTSF